MQTKLKKMTQSSVFSVAVIAVAMILVMRIIRDNYFSSNNIVALLKALAVTTIVGVSQMISIGSGGMNVSIGSTGALSAISAALVMQNYNVHPIPAMLLAFAIGACCGVINGLLIYRNGGVGVASFLTTMATSSVFTGITLIMTKGRGVAKVPKEFVAIGNTELGPIPTSIFFMVAVVVIFWLFFRYAPAGRRILAFGANAKAAELYGVNRLKCVLLVNVLASLVAALAGMLVVMRVGSAQPDIGSDWMLTSFAVSLMGGTRQAGGKVNAPGVILGGIIMTVIANALVHLGADVYWTQLINGIVILGIMALDQLKNIKK